MPFWGPVSGIQRYTTMSPLSDGWPWYLPEKCYTLRHILYQCSYEYAKCIQYKIHIGRRSRQSSWRKREGKWMPQFMKPYEWVYIKTCRLRDSSTPISLKRIDLASSKFATYYPGIDIMYPSQKIIRETSHFRKEPPNTILALFLVYRDPLRLTHFRMAFIYPKMAMLSVKFCINVA